MFIKKFMIHSKILYILLRIFSFAAALMILASIIMYLTTGKSMTVVGNRAIEIIAFESITQTLPKNIDSIIQTILAVCMLATYSYLLFIGGSFFKALSLGDTPFSKESYNILRKTGIILMVINVSIPIIYSLIATLLLSDGHYLSVGLSPQFFLGFIIYTIGEIFQYGVALQELSDDTV